MRHRSLYVTVELTLTYQYSRKVATRLMLVPPLREFTTGPIIMVPSGSRDSGKRHVSQDSTTTSQTIRP